MLIEAVFKTKGQIFHRIINTDKVVYIDELGVLFAPGEHAVFDDGEYGRVRDLIALNGDKFYSTVR